MAQGLARADAVTVAVVGVGQWAPGESTIHDLLDEVERRELAARGVVGEVAGVFFDKSGNPLRPKVAARMITIDPDQLARIPEVVAVVSGAAKSTAVRAALEGRLLQSLVIDLELAESLLS